MNARRPITIHRPGSEALEERLQILYTPQLLMATRSKNLDPMCSVRSCLLVQFLVLTFHEELNRTNLPSEYVKNLTEVFMPLGSLRTRSPSFQMSSFVRWWHPKDFSSQQCSFYCLLCSKRSATGLLASSSRNFTNSQIIGRKRCSSVMNFLFFAVHFHF